MQHQAILRRLTTRAGLDKKLPASGTFAAGDRYASSFSQMYGLQLQINDREVFFRPDRQLAQAWPGIWLDPDGLSDELRQSLMAER
jgi:hypothetical protein